MATICATVLSLPIMCPDTLCDAPIGASYSRSGGDKHTVMVKPTGEGGGGKATSWLMKKDKIVFSTPSGASITLEGDKIILKAAKIEQTATGGILIESAAGDVTIKGTPKIKLNP